MRQTRCVEQCTHHSCMYEIHKADGNLQDLVQVASAGNSHDLLQALLQGLHIGLRLRSETRGRPLERHGNRKAAQEKKQCLGKEQLWEGTMHHDTTKQCLNVYCKRDGTSDIVAARCLTSRCLCMFMCTQMPNIQSKMSHVDKIVDFVAPWSIWNSRFCSSLVCLK